MAAAKMPPMGGGGMMGGDKGPDLGSVFGSKPKAPPGDESEATGDLDPDFEEAAIEAWPELEGDTTRLLAIQEAIRAASKPKPSLGLMIGIGKGKK